MFGLRQGGQLRLQEEGLIIRKAVIACAVPDYEVQIFEWAATILISYMHTSSNVWKIGMTNTLFLKTFLLMWQTNLSLRILIFSGKIH